MKERRRMAKAIVYKMPDDAGKQKTWRTREESPNHELSMSEGHLHVKTGAKTVAIFAPGEFTHAELREGRSGSDASDEGDEGEGEDE
jgi:hypothetical protein